jgi:hypothetical protein
MRSSPVRACSGSAVSPSSILSAIAFRGSPLHDIATDVVKVQEAVTDQALPTFGSGARQVSSRRLIGVGQAPGRIWRAKQTASPILTRCRTGCVTRGLFDPVEMSQRSTRCVNPSIGRPVGREACLGSGCRANRQGRETPETMAYRQK